jgi:putative heme-binding domain-containing protein
LALLGAPPAKRDEVVASYLSALTLAGNAAKGQKIYLERCATCHRIGDQGHAVGPDMGTVKASGKETILINILDPNREVAPRFLNYSVDTISGESVSGIIAGDSPSNLTLRGPNGVETSVARTQIARMQASSQSLMPEGLEIGLTPADLADLVEYIISVP